MSGTAESARAPSPTGEPGGCWGEARVVSHAAPAPVGGRAPGLDGPAGASGVARRMHQTCGRRGAPFELPARIVREPSRAPSIFVEAALERARHQHGRC